MANCNKTARGLIIHTMTGSSAVIAVWCESQWNGEREYHPLRYLIEGSIQLLDLGSADAADITAVTERNAETGDAEYREQVVEGIPERIEETPGGGFRLWVKNTNGMIGAAESGEWQFDFLEAFPKRGEPGVLDWWPRRLGQTPAVKEDSVRVQVPTGLILDVCETADTNPVREKGTLLTEWKRDAEGNIEVDDDGRPVPEQVGAEGNLVDKVGSLVLSFERDFFGTGHHAWTGGGTVVVKITGPYGATGSGSGEGNGGMYLGKILTGQTSDPLPNADLGMPQGMTEPAEDDAIILNADENDSPPGTHWLREGGYSVGKVVGTITDSGSGGASYKVVVIPRGVPRDDRDVSEASEEGEVRRLESATDECGGGGSGGGSGTIDSWHRVADNEPLIMEWWSRAYYCKASKELFQYKRTMTYDASGRLVNVGEPSKVLVTTAEEC